ncbi:MAG: hypothetical protein ABJB01_13785 [Rudaea sp.]
MLNLLQLLRDIIQLRRGPQDMPYSMPLFAAVCVASLALQLGIAYLMGIEGDTLAAGLIGLGINLGFLYLILTLRGFANRFVQTATTLLSCTIVFSIITVPIVFLVGTRPMTPEQMSPLQALLGLLSLPVVIWKLVVDAHILRNSLSIPFIGGLGVAILWIVAEYAIGSVLHTQSVP